MKYPQLGILSRSTEHDVQLADDEVEDAEERGAKTDAYIAGVALGATKGVVNHHQTKKDQRKNRGPVVDAMIVSTAVKATGAATKKVVKKVKN